MAKANATEAVALIKGHSSIPTAPGAMPLLGHTHKMLHNPFAFLSGLPKHGDLVRIRIGRQDMILLCDAALTRAVLLNPRTYDKGGPIMDRGREFVGDGLVTCPYSEHRRMRRLIQPAFHPTRLPGYAEVMTAEIDTVTSRWADGDIIDVPAEMERLAARVLMRTLFGNALGPEEQVKAANDLRILVYTGYRRALTPSFVARLPTRANIRYERSRERLHAIIGRAIAARRADNTGSDDLLTELLTASDPKSEDQGAQLTDQELFDNVVIFFAAGTGTTASALSWALHLLACHPQFKRRLAAEVDALLASRTATFDDLPRLILTNQVIKESLRLYPPGWIATRKVMHSTELGEYRIPEGSVLVYSPYLLHHREDLHAAPERFVPERWAPGGEATQRRDAFIPFGAGPRMCIGDRFGMTEAVLALATIAARWDFTHADSRPVYPRSAITLSPKRLHMRVSSR